jgi:hypothetical protein
MAEAAQPVQSRDYVFSMTFSEPAEGHLAYIRAVIAQRPGLYRFYQPCFADVLHRLMVTCQSQPFIADEAIKQQIPPTSKTRIECPLQEHCFERIRGRSDVCARRRTATRVCHSRGVLRPW